MIYIVAAHQSERLRYTCDFIFGRVLRISYQFSSAASLPQGSVLGYGVPPQPGGMPTVPAAGLMPSTGLPHALPEVTDREGVPFIYEFARASGSRAFSFDIFSAVFFCLSRAEEYFPGQRDKHGRFPAGASIFAAWLEQPYVDQWIRLFGKWLIEEGLINELPPVHASWINTLDIDIAFAYQGRSKWRAAGAMLKDALNFRGKRLAERFAVFAGRQSDPYDTYQLWLDAGSHADALIYFVLSGKRGPYDINLDVHNAQVSSMLKSLQSVARPGLHPSYGSLNKADSITSERSALEAACGAEVRESRQHFLRMLLPATYRALEQAGIATDYSMGYADAVGFRAGTAHPFTFFNLERSRSSHLLLVPLIAMDSALKEYMKLRPEEAIAKLIQLQKLIEDNGGQMVTVWHNHSLSDRDGWQGWQQVYTAFAAYMLQKG